KEVLPALRNTLKNLQLDYLDLYLIHWPVAVKKGVDYATKKDDFLNKSEAPLRLTWSAMEEALDLGMVRHLGLSNFNQDKIREIISSAKSLPEVNQVEMHPFLPQNTLLKFCSENNIVVTAYAPLGSAYRVNNGEVDFPILLDNEIIREIAQKHHASPA